VLSPIFYQYSNLEVFDVWLISPLRQYGFSLIPTYALIVAALLVLAVIPLIWAILPRVAALQATRTAASRGVLPGRFALYSLVLLLSAAAVYALGGGYSLEARKRYLIVVNVILMIGALGHWLWNRFMRRSEAMRVHTHSGKPLTVMAIVLITLGCATSLMMMSVWQRELARLDSLLATIVAEHLKGPIVVEWNPYLFDIWPHAERSWGGTFDEAMKLGFQFGYGVNPPVTVFSKADRQIRWNSDLGRWMTENSAMTENALQWKDAP
jgi:hypothetical protein